MCAAVVRPAPRRWTSSSRARRRCARSSGSARCALTLPRWPAMRLPGNTRPGSCACRSSPGVLCETRVAVARAVRDEMVALDHAGEALAVRRAGHVDLLADLRTCPTPTCVARLEVREPRPRVTRNSFSMRPASTPALAKWPASGLLTRDGAALAVGDLHGGVAVGVRRLDLGDAVVRHVQHRHRDGCRHRR